MLGNFDKIFHPEKEWKDKKLTDMCPCNTCDTYKEYHDKALYGNIAERQYAELPESCRTCIPHINWQMDCMAKLGWYERNDESLKKKEV